ncbi:hypothetical protein ACHAW6_001290 [Cyclotella cf. meneghiniana]
MKTLINASLFLLLSTRRSLGLKPPPHVQVASRTMLSRLHVLFPNKRGIIVQADGEFVAKDPLLDDFMGRRSSARDVLRNDNAPPSPSLSSFGARQNSLKGENTNNHILNKNAVRGPSATDPQNMKIRDIQEELQRRHIYFADCFDRESLVKRLWEARGGDDDIASDDNGWGRNYRTPDDGLWNQDSSFSFNERTESANGWKENDPNSFYSSQETAFGYNEMSYSADFGVNRQSIFAPTSPYKKSEQWVYSKPVPPRTPPPGYYED